MIPAMSPSLLLIALLVFPARFAPVTVQRVEAEGYTMTHHVPAPSARVGSYLVMVRIARDAGAPAPADLDLRLLVRQNDRPFRSMSIARMDTTGTWVAEMPVFPQGSSVRYRFEARLPGGTLLALPEGGRDATFHYLVVAPVPRRVTVVRDGLLWLSLTLAGAASAFAVRAARDWGGRTHFDWAVSSGALAALTFFAGAVCVSWIHSFHAAGAMWATMAEGRNHVPWLSLAVAGYWALVVVAFRDRLLRSTLPSHRTARLAMAAFATGALAILTYLVVGPVSP